MAGGSKPAPAEFDEIEKLMDDIEDDPDAQRRVVQLLRPLLPKEAASSEDASDRFLNDSPNILIKNLQKSLNPPPISAGSNASSLDPFSTGTVSGLGRRGEFPRCPWWSEGGVHAHDELCDVLPDEGSCWRCWH